MKKFILFLTFLTTIFIFACNKSEIKNDVINETIEEIDDHTSQEEEVVSVDLQVEIKDGRMVFKNHEEMIRTLEALTNYNVESIREWEKQIGFNSLSQEYYRLTELDKEEILSALEFGRYKDYFTISENGLEVNLYTPYLMQIINSDGIFQIGDDIGSIGIGLNIWTPQVNKVALLEALSNKSLTGLEDYNLIEGEYFDNTLSSAGIRSSYNTTCPKTSNYVSPIISSSRPDGKRKIKGRWAVNYLTTGPFSNRNYTVIFSSESWSHKKCCKYKTKHYYSHDLETTSFSGTVANFSSSGVSCNNCRSVQRITTLASYIGVTGTFLASNGITFTEARLNGTYVHHQGMGAGRELNFSCY